MTETNSIFIKNITVLKKRFPEIAKKIIEADKNDDYTGTEKAKTGENLPVLKNGKSFHSKYNPVRESEKMFTGNENFILFCGLGGGIHIEYFLKTFKEYYCAATEASYPTLKNLLEIIDFSNIFDNKRFFFFPPITDTSFNKIFIQSYIPALHGNFEIKILRTWEDFYKDNLEVLKNKINQAFDLIKTDTATQAAFGKIWMRNLLLNLKTASNINPKIPKPDLTKTALILGAGPSLEKDLTKIKNNRNTYVIFCSDTAFPILNTNNINADFFISIDPQIISYSHCFKPFSDKTIAIFDLCANPTTVNQFENNGNNFFFTKGNHPFSRYASYFSPFPYMDTGSGTVAIAAKAAALSMGFKNIEISGLDFAYTEGKAYANGTYLSKKFTAESTKTEPLETSFINLMFRTPVKKIMENGKITYTAELLNGYKIFFNSGNISFFIWKNEEFKTFPYNQFIEILKNEAKKQSPQLKTGFLPYFTYKSKNFNKNKSNLCDLELVLSDILGYTIVR